MKLTVIRHGQTIDNVNGIIQGQLPGSLTELGKKQSQETAELLANEHLDQVWSSDLRRVVDTAKLVTAPHPDLRLQLSPSLREYHFGVMQGQLIKSWDWPHIGDNPLKAKAQGGEDTIELATRILDFINNLLKNSPNDSILVVTHNGPIRVMRAVIDKQKLSSFFDEEAPHTQPFKFEINEPLKLEDLRW